MARKNRLTEWLERLWIERIIQNKQETETGNTERSNGGDGVDPFASVFDVKAINDQIEAIKRMKPQYAAGMDPIDFDSISAQPSIHKRNNVTGEWERWEHNYDNPNKGRPSYDSPVYEKVLKVYHQLKKIGVAPKGYYKQDEFWEIVMNTLIDDPDFLSAANKYSFMGRNFGKIYFTKVWNDIAVKVGIWVFTTGVPDRKHGKAGWPYGIQDVIPLKI